MNKLQNSWKSPHEVIEQIQNYTSDSVHDDLGIITKGEKTLIRLYRPGYSETTLELLGKQVKASLVHQDGIFECECPKHTTHLDYRVYHDKGLLDHDPYALSPSLSLEDSSSVTQKNNLNLDKILGATLMTHQGCFGVRFTLFAPSALQVRLHLDTNNNDPSFLLFRKLSPSGVYELFVPGIDEGVCYQFEIITQDKAHRLKTDPFGKYFEIRPNTEAKIFDVSHFEWDDATWLKKRKTNNLLEAPYNIYEVHLGSWIQSKTGFYNYKELAPKLVDYCQKMNFTHVELLPLSEHPLDESWGYQVTGYFAPTSRFGSPKDFQSFVNYLHINDIGVIMDFVPGHFPLDEFSLSKFDGTALFEHEELGIHPNWTTHYFDYAKPFVSSFLLSSANYWIANYHIDGIRVDAVASMIHLDFGREEGQWTPNKHGGKEHLEGLEFLKQFNISLSSAHPDVLRIAEDTSTFQGITHPIEKGGLGFHLKWNLGLCHDLVDDYLSNDFEHRFHRYDNLKFVFDYGFSEAFLIPLSHDDVTHARKSYISKFFGSKEEQFLQFKAYLVFVYCYPGKKLLFMGQEFAQKEEWSCQEPIHWHLLKKIDHQLLQDFVSKLSKIYLAKTMLWNFNQKDFRFVVCNQKILNLFVFCISDLICCFNFSNKHLQSIELNISCKNSLALLLSNRGKNSGSFEDSGVKMDMVGGQIVLSLEPLTACILENKDGFGEYDKG